MNDSIYSSSIFIGREKEIAAFNNMLSATDNGQWILHLYGPGGIGKTKLLQQFIEMVEQKRATGQSILFTQQLIDLYWTVNQQEIGLLKSIAEQLGEEYFAGFLTAVQTYEKIFNNPAGPSPELLREKQSQARDKFFKAYAGLPADLVFLFFDTAEVGGDASGRFWSEILPQLKEKHPGTQVVIAGRQKLEQLEQEQTKFLPVTAFTSSEVNSYFQEHKIDIEPEIVDRIANLSKGRPILIALAADWVRYGFAPDKLVACSKPGDFEKLMIDQVGKLQTEDVAIMAMSHFYRRFDERILAYILGTSLDEAREQIETVAEFSFVKYRPPLADQLGSCLLHDEMRDLVNKYFWSELEWGPGPDYRQDWDSKIVDYYATLVEQEKSVLEKQALQLERLFYWLSADLPQGFDYSHELFAEARKRRDTNLMEAIGREFARVESQLTPDMQDELAFREGLIIHGHGRYDEAIDALTPLAQKPDMAPLLQAAARVQLLEAYVYAGELPDAVEKGLRWETWLNNLLQQPLDDETKQQIEFEFGKLCNNIGLALRNQNKLQETIDYYNQALYHFSLAGVGAYADIANTENNLAYVLHRLGRDDEALSYCDSALEIRKRLRSSEQLGYSYNVRGSIFVAKLREQEARINFQWALEQFDKASSRRGRGLVYIAYGRALRQLGRHIERNAQAEFNPDRQEYLESGRMLQEAVTIFRDLEDEANLSEALNEYGTLLRQQRQWQRARECFAESKELAQKVKNDYRVVDNLVDVAITYNYEGGSPENALNTAMEARSLALGGPRNLRAYNLYAKAQEVIANILFAQKHYDEAFRSVADACIYMWRLDPEKLGESAAKRELYYDQMVNWAGEKILQLPTQELVNQKTTYLIERWQQEEEGQGKLADKYPGFIIRMRDLARDYQFLKMNPVEE